MNRLKPAHETHSPINLLLSSARLVFLLAAAALLLTACSSRRTEEISRYGDSMSVFFNKLSGYDSDLSSIDPSDPDASSLVLSVIDEIAEECDWAASLEVPEGFEDAAGLTKEVNDSMQFARLEYHKAFESDPFSEESYEKASAYYETACGRLQELLQVLQDAD